MKSKSVLTDVDVNYADTVAVVAVAVGGGFDGGLRGRWQWSRRGGEEDPPIAIIVVIFVVVIVIVIIVIMAIVIVISKAQWGGGGGGAQMTTMTTTPTPRLRSLRGNGNGGLGARRLGMTMPPAEDGGGGV